MITTFKAPNGMVISLESDDAGVPDTTAGAGPSILDLEDDAQLDPNDANAEFDAAETESAAEKEDTPQSAQNGNESWFDAVFGIESKRPTTKKKKKKASMSVEDLEDIAFESLVDDGEDDDADEGAADDGATDAAADADVGAPDDGGDVGTDGEGEGAGEVTEGDNVTTVSLPDGATITITGAAGSAPAAPVANDGGEDPSVGSGDAEGECGDPAANNNAGLESFFQNLGLL